jgi:hypothetical protein
MTIVDQAIALSLSVFPVRLCKEPISEWPDWLIARQQCFSAQWLRSQICNSGVSGITAQHTLVVNRNRTVLIYEV